MKTTMTRRQMVGRLATSLPLLGTLPSLVGAEGPGRKRLGVALLQGILRWTPAEIVVDPPAQVEHGEH